MSEDTDETRYTGTPASTRLYIERALDKRVGPLEAQSTRHDERLKTVEGKITKLFDLRNTAENPEIHERRGMSGKQKAVAGTGGAAGLAGAAYLLAELLKYLNGSA